MTLDTLSVVIPAYNEARRIGGTLARIFEYLAGSVREWDVIVVDDGSTDGTAEVAAEAAKGRTDLVVLRNPVNRGKGYSTRAGALAARHEYVLLSDADLSTPIEELEKLAPFATPRSVVIASRGMAESMLEVRQPFYRETMGRIFNLIVQTLLVRGVSDTQCGFKLFGREVVAAVFPELETDRFAFDVELLARATRKGFAIHEVPVRWRNDERTRVHAVTDSLQMLSDVVRIWWRV